MMVRYLVMAVLALSLSPKIANGYDTDPGCVDLNRSKASLSLQLGKEINHCRVADDCRFLAVQNMGFHAHKSEIPKAMIYTQTMNDLLCAEGFAIGMPARVPKSYACEAKLCVPRYSDKRSAMDTGPFDDERPDWAKKYPADYNLSNLSPEEKGRFAAEAKARLCEQAEKAMACGKKRGRIQKK